MKREILADQKSCWLVFSDACGLGAQIVQRLEQEAGHVITVMGGDRFRRVNDNVYILNPRQRDDYDTLLKELLVHNKIPKQFFIYGMSHQTSILKQDVLALKSFRISASTVCSFWQKHSENRIY